MALNTLSSKAARLRSSSQVSTARMAMMMNSLTILKRVCPCPATKQTGKIRHRKMLATMRAVTAEKPTTRSVSLGCRWAPRKRNPASRVRLSR